MAITARLRRARVTGIDLTPALVPSRFEPNEHRVPVGSPRAPAVDQFGVVLRRGLDGEARADRFAIGAGKCYCGGRASATGP